MIDITKHKKYLYPHPVFKGEIFRKIPNDKNHEISNYGRIRIIGRLKIDKYKRRLIRNTKILKPNVNRDGYVYVSGSRYKPHVLVLETFDCLRPDKKCCNHKDGNKLNNHISNLEWVTWSENMKHAWANGLNKGRSKLKSYEVRLIRYAVKNKLRKQTELAEMFGVHNGTIADIVHYRNWKNI